MNTAEQEAANRHAAFAFWRFHLWTIGCGSYNDIERKVADGELTAFVCPKQDCDCEWSKVQPELGRSL